MNKSNVKASLYDLLNQHSNSNLNEKAQLTALSPKTNKKLGYAGAGVTDVDKQMLNARTSLQSLLQRSHDRHSQEMESPTNPMSQVQSKNLLDGTLIPDKDVEIGRDVQKQREGHVSATYRSSFLPYSFNITQRSGEYQAASPKLRDSPAKKLQRRVHD